MNFRSLGEFEAAFPPQYNIYYPDNDQTSQGKFDILMKILPEPASRIYSGKKKFELRKYVPKHTGFLFLLESQKIPSITGGFFFFDYISDSVPNLWNRVGELATRKEKFEKYFSGKEYGVALEIFDFEKSHKPLPITEMYDLFPDMPKIPQPLVYMYIPVGSPLSSLLRSRTPHLAARRGG